MKDKQLLVLLEYISFIISVLSYDLNLYYSALYNGLVGLALMIYLVYIYKEKK